MSQIIRKQLPLEGESELYHSQNLRGFGEGADWWMRISLRIVEPHYYEGILREKRETRIQMVSPNCEVWTDSWQMFTWFRRAEGMSLCTDSNRTKVYWRLPSIKRREKLDDGHVQKWWQ